MNILYIFFLLFTAFPYTRIVQNESYNQPYALLLSAIILLLVNKKNFNKFPKKDWYFLLAFSTIGLIFFVATCYPYNNIQEYKYLLNFISPLLLVLCSYVVLKKLKKTALKILTYSLYSWLAVSVIQLVYDPGFLTFLATSSSNDLGLNIINSGRGAIGFAPEPTHSGFHLLLLGVSISLLTEKKKLLVFSVFGAIFIALSSSAALAFCLGLFFYIGLKGFLRMKSASVFVIPILILFFLVMYFFVIDAIYIYSVESETRLLRLISRFIENPFSVLMDDYSVNARIGGLISGWIYIFNDFLMPHGLSHEHWLNAANDILSENRWLLGMSNSGLPSGIGIVFFQLGFLAILLIYPFYRVYMASSTHFQFILTSTFIFIFMFQFMISTPIFSLIYAISIFKNVRV